MILTARKSSVDDIALRTGYAQTFAVLKEFDRAGIAQSEGDVLLAFPRKSLSAFDDALLHDGTVNRDERPTAIVETRLNGIQEVRGSIPLVSTTSKYFPVKPAFFVYGLIEECSP